jgi:hypothetical protein
MPQVVCTKLNFVAFFCKSSGTGHNSSIVHQDIKAGGGGSESIGCLLDGFEGGKVEGEEFNFRIRNEGFD